MKRYALFIIIFTSLMVQSVSAMGNEVEDRDRERALMDKAWRERLEGKARREQQARRAQPPGNTYKRVGVYHYEDKKINAAFKKQVSKTMPRNLKKFIYNAIRKEKRKNNPDIKSGSCNRSILLSGLPGNGKTTMAKVTGLIICNQYYYIRGSLVANEYQNSGAKNLEREFMPFLNQSAGQKPQLIIIDEVDTLTDNFFKKNGSNAGTAQGLWLLMSQLEDAGHFLICTTNKKRTDLPLPIVSRFKNKIIHIPNPSALMRKYVILFNLKKHYHNLKSKDIRQLVAKTKNKSIRDIEGLFGEACEELSYRTLSKFEIDSEISLDNIEDILTYADFETVIKSWPSPYSIGAMWGYVKKHKDKIIPQIIPFLSFTLSVFSTFKQWKHQALSIALQGIGTRVQYELFKKNYFDYENRYLKGQAVVHMPDSNTLNGDKILKKGRLGGWGYPTLNDEEGYKSFWISQNKKHHEEEREKALNVFLAESENFLYGDLKEQ